MLDIITALGPFYTFLIVLVICFTVGGVISRIALAFEKRPKPIEQPKPTPTDQT